jgi:hypothetical protein
MYCHETTGKKKIIKYIYDYYHLAYKLSRITYVTMWYKLLKVKNVFKINFWTLKYN